MADIGCAPTSEIRNPTSEIPLLSCFGCRRRCTATASARRRACARSSHWCSCRSDCLVFTSCRAMTFECSRRRKFSEFVAHHVFCHINRNELLSVMNRNGVADHFGNDRRPPRPGLVDLLFVP